MCTVNVTMVYSALSGFQGRVVLTSKSLPLGAAQTKYSLVRVAWYLWHIETERFIVGSQMNYLELCSTTSSYPQVSTMLKTLTSLVGYIIQFYSFHIITC